MNRNFSAGAAITLVLGLILVFATSGNTISLGSFAISLVTVGWILTVVGAVLLVISLIPRRTSTQTRHVDPAGRESVTERDSHL
ncbi:MULTISPECIES: DUF6458 family protein [Kocuria]|uniref:DUF6458 family protein n=1 Tax=Kocuria oceani TaxID=988827 RepID=A0ABV9TLZ0_9MICC|nr:MULTISPECIES: DUF6458 family protein [Kocuria]KLU08237.1 hypothetical protein ABL57_19455 [Kocuria sp. SM24M-10]OLT11123.1 hypothetical protein BJF77_07350 [Kocuria sp. CNJ-770]